MEVLGLLRFRADRKRYQEVFFENNLFEGSTNKWEYRRRSFPQFEHSTEPINSKT